jgi:DNA mismatch repair protein MutS
MPNRAKSAITPPSDAETAKPSMDSRVTPSMAQFLEIKAANPDCILWYRMGDFYELFFEDAVVAAEALSIVLTKRGKHLGQDIPMCGVPIHRADEYLQRLIKKGFRVAVCEQLEDPAEAKKRGSKSIVRRDVVRLVTPGTLTEDSLLDARARNYLTALASSPRLKNAAGGGREDAYVALASIDISTGECEIGEVAAADLAGELVRLAPSEIIVRDATQDQATIEPVVRMLEASVTPVPAATFDSLSGERQLKARLGVADLAAYGAFSRTELAAIGAVLKYVELTQIGRQPMLRAPRRTGASSVMVIDAATRTSLELLRATSGDRAGSLLGALDRTVTGAGARELAHRLASPLRDRDAITMRLDALGYLVESETLRETIRATLAGVPDVARAMSRLTFQRGGPRDLAAVRDTLNAARTLAKDLDAAGGVGLPADLDAVRRQLAGVDQALATRLGNALIDDPPYLRRDGGFVRPGFHAELDEARQLADDSRHVMAKLEARYLELSGNRTLKVRHNSILGYYIEVSAATAKPMLSAPLDETFRHRQTLANAVRFTTTELIEIEGRISTAGERALGLEQQIFNDLAGEIDAAQHALSALAEALATLDCTAALADVAAAQNYVRPTLVDAPVFEVRDGRHPVVEQALSARREANFIANDCVLGGGDADPSTPGFDEMPAARIWLVTGPNMAGKSTFLRQNALITVMAQMGSFVPARSARIGLADRLFSRVGASDDLARGRSTFMVEMVETAAILNQATDRSLVILDEIGRGTATFDGLSIAWATIEYLHEVTRCRALFATHYHEMTALAGRLAEVANVTMDVREFRDAIVFLHKVRAGAADRSYGIQVAKLAGLPAKVIKRAGDVLRLLEKTQTKSGRAQALVDDLPLFSATRPESFLPAEPHAPSAVERAVAEINPDELTPKEALEALYRLKALGTDDKERS